jgi:hypothetical protein
MVGLSSRFLPGVACGLMLIDRLNALVWTCALELPVYGWWLRSRFLRPLVLIAVVIGLQCVTQLLLWEYTLRTAGRLPELVLAECSVVLAEAGLLYLAGKRIAQRPVPLQVALGAAFFANLLSLLCGLLLNQLLYNQDF